MLMKLSPALVKAACKMLVKLILDLGVVGVVVSGFQFAHCPFH